MNGETVVDYCQHNSKRYGIDVVEGVPAEFVPLNDLAAYIRAALELRRAQA